MFVRLHMEIFTISQDKINLDLHFIDAQQYVEHSFANWGAGRVQADFHFQSPKAGTWQAGRWVWVGRM